MAKTVTYSNRAVRDLAAIDRQQATRVRNAIKRYADTGHGDVRPYEGTGMLRLRVGVYRVLFNETATHVNVERVRHRREAYR